MMPLQTFSGRNPSQNEFELRSFIALLRDRGVTRYLEIGARHGDTFHEVMTSLPAGSTGVAVDMPGGVWGKNDSRQALQKAVGDLNRRSYKCSCRFGDSQTSATKRLIVGRRPDDAVLPVAGHDRGGVPRDWNLYHDIAPLIAFHDIVGTGQREKVKGNEVQVPILWAEIRDRYETVEFVDHGSKMGIGVCFSI